MFLFNGSCALTTTLVVLAKQHINTPPPPKYKKTPPQLQTKQQNVPYGSLYIWDKFGIFHYSKTLIFFFFPHHTKIQAQKSERFIAANRVWVEIITVLNSAITTVSFSILFFLKKTSSGKEKTKQIKLMRSQLKVMYIFSLKRHLLQGILLQGRHWCILAFRSRSHHGPSKDQHWGREKVGLM